MDAARAVTMGASIALGVVWGAIALGWAVYRIRRWLRE